jgi:dinuclear metal center YbgI/SA1388 family protein
LALHLDSYMKLKEVINYLETLAPKAYQEDYDNAGLLTSHDNEVQGILVALDCTEEVIAEAIERGCNLVVAHHPIVFRGLKKITGKNYVERTLIKAIKHDVAIFAIHTNLDNMLGGVNARIGDLMGLENQRILSPKKGLLSKLYTFVPKDSADLVRNALFSAGAGSIGNYEECSYNTEGLGTFKAGAGAHPFVGNLETQHQELEVKIEVIFPTHQQGAILTALKQAHPYEEVAFDVVALENAHPYIGSGMVGELPTPMPVEAFLREVKNKFGCGGIKYAGKTAGPIQRVAICGGAGFFLLPAAIAAGADVFLTGDVKYHEFFDAEDKIVLADMGHFESEQFTIDLLVDELQKKFTTFAVLKVNTNTNPVKYL